MPYDGAGNFTRSYNWVADKNAVIKITASRMDAEFDNYASALNQVYLRSGVAAMTGDLYMGNNGIKNVSSGSVGTPAVRFNSDATTGIYSPAVGEVAISTAGTQRIRAFAGGVTLVGATMSLGGLVDIQPIDGANEGAEIKLRGSPNATVDFEIDQNVDTLRIFTTDKGLLTTPVQRFSIGKDGKVSSFGTSGSAQLQLGTSANYLGLTGTDAGAFNLLHNSTNSTVMNFGTTGNIPLAVLTNNTEVVRVDASGNMSVGSTGGDFSRTWRGVFVKAQNATTQVGVGNTTSGASAVAQFSAFGATSNSFLDMSLKDNTGSPFVQFNAGSSVTDFRFSSNGTTVFKVTSAGVITDLNGNELGYKDVPQVTLTSGSRTLALTDRNKHIYATSTATGITVPPNSSVAFPIGTIIQYINGTSGNTTVTQGAGVTLTWTPSGSTGNRTVITKGMCTVEKVETDVWYISGPGLS